MNAIQLSSNAAAVLAQLQRFPRAMLLRVAGAIDRENEFTIAAIQANKLSRRGPTTLGVVTNRLRSSMARANATIVGDNLGVVSAIGSNVIYAGVHEYGIDRNVTVRAHERRLFDRHVAAGEKYLDKRGKIRSAPSKVTKVERSSVTVRAHDRHMKLPARAYISSTLELRMPNYSEAVSVSIVDAWHNPSAS